jgi:hypothetical protein
MMPPLTNLYADAAVYTTFLALDPVLSLDATASLDAAAGAQP